MSSMEERSLTVIVVDVSPVPWGQREVQRNASDKVRLAAGKRTAGPCKLEECLCAIQAFCAASSNLQRDVVPIIIAVAGNEVAVVYPRKDALEEYFANPENKLDSRKLQSDLILGVAELVATAAEKLQSKDIDPSPNSTLAAMASALSISLCLINRFLVAANAGVSALHHHSWNRGNRDDAGVIAALGGGDGGGSGNKKSHKNRVWSPRILLVQASDDRSSDYNAVMNCAFAAVKQNIAVDGCFLQASGAVSSSFLEQTCDMTGGLFLAPAAASQANNILTEVLLTIFLPPRSSRKRLATLGINSLDFRTRSFDTGEIVDMAFVCNQCLSVFSHKPIGRCPTCDAEIRSKSHPSTE